MTQPTSQETATNRLAPVSETAIGAAAVSPPGTSSPRSRSGLGRLTREDLTYAIGIAVACLISYSIMTAVLNRLVARDDDLLGGMWAAVAAAFVFRTTPAQAVSAIQTRSVATAVSFVLCLIYLLFAPPTAIGMAIIIAVGACVLQMVQRRDSVITMAITTSVVMVVAIMKPTDAVAQPLLRCADTIVGMAVALACSWAVAPLKSGERS